MYSNQNLFSIGEFDFKLNHLLIIGILSLSFSVSFLIRSQPADFGWELNEFDPFFNFRATQYIVDNGIDAYFQWNDELSWYPHGRDISSNSQVMLHITAAISYWIFGGGESLYDFTILFPVIFGSLTTIVVFGLVRIIGGTTAGLFASLLFSVSLPIIIRGQVGWFKSEPLGLFFSILAVYLFLSGIKSTNKKFAIVKLVSAGIFIIFGLSAWGGDQFFIMPLGIFFLTLPFLRTDHKFLIWAIPLFTISSIITSLGFERLGMNFITGLGGLSLIIPTILLICSIAIQSKTNHKNRNTFVFLIIIIISSGFLILNTDFVSLPSHRYLNAVNPFLTTTDPLVDSVSEHATTTLSQSFLFHSVLMIFAGIGIWFILKNSKKSNFIKNDMISFSLIVGLMGVYVSSAFVRLEVFASFAIIILSSLGLSILFKELFSRKSEYKTFRNIFIKLSFSTGLVFLLMTPLIFPLDDNIFDITKNPPTILNGGTSFQISTSDWLDAMEWIKNNTPEDAVIGSWWDYGYWIQTKADRASLADNSTLLTHIINKIASVFLNSPDDSWHVLNDMGADYFLIFVAGNRLNVDHEGIPLYVLQGGGDESKKQWFMRITGEPLPKYLHDDGLSGTDYFWNETLLGKMIPFSPLAYVNLENSQQSATYQPGFTPIYVKDIKFSIEDNGPLRLVYSSPSFDAKNGEQMIAVFIYEVNKDYVSIN